MKRVNGIITEATEAELQKIWQESNWNKTASFESFKRLMVEEGCSIIGGEVQCQNSETSSSVADVQSTTSETKTIVTADQQEMVKPIVSVTSITHPEVEVVNTAKVETTVSTKPVTTKSKQIIINKGGK